MARRRRKQKLRRAYLKPFSASLVNTGHTLDRSTARILFPSLRSESMNAPPPEHMTRKGGTYVQHNGAYARVQRFHFEYKTPDRHVVLKEEWKGLTLIQKLMLFLPNDEIKGWVFVEVQDGVRWRSIEYANRERAYKAFHESKITWIEKITVGAPQEQLAVSPSPG